jgi:hypothetical protein
MSGGKGDKRRPTDERKFRDGWDRIHRKPKPDSKPESNQFRSYQDELKTFLNNPER